MPNDDLRLALLARGSDFNIWYYRMEEEHNLGQLVSEGFFNPYGNVMRKNDLVILSRRDGTSAGMAVVNQTGAIVDLTNASGFDPAVENAVTALRADDSRLGVLAYANGFTLWHYHCDDDVLEVQKKGYWDTTAGLLQPGDVLFGRYTANGDTRWGYTYVKRNDGKRVTVSHQNTFL